MLTRASRHTLHRLHFELLRPIFQARDNFPKPCILTQGSYPISGLVHLSELSWDPVHHPEDLLSVGQEVKVKVINIDMERLRLALSIKQLENDPLLETIDTVMPVSVAVLCWFTLTLARNLLCAKTSRAVMPVSVLVHFFCWRAFTLAWGLLCAETFRAWGFCRHRFSPARSCIRKSGKSVRRRRRRELNGSSCNFERVHVRKILTFLRTCLKIDPLSDMRHDHTREPRLIIYSLCVLQAHVPYLFSVPLGFGPVSKRMQFSNTETA